MDLSPNGKTGQGVSGEHTPKKNYPFIPPKYPNNSAIVAGDNLSICSKCHPKACANRARMSIHAVSNGGGESYSRQMNNAFAKSACRLTKHRTNSDAHLFDTRAPFGGG